MIYLNSDSFDAQLSALASAFDKFPKHIAKKHIGAAMKRALSFALPTLRRNTPKAKATGNKSGLKRNASGHFIKGTGQVTGKKKTGGLRRAAIATSKYIGTNAAGFTIGSLGYKFGAESRKAIFLEFGTKHGIEPRLFMAKTFDAVKDKVKHKLSLEMMFALEKAARDLAPGVDQKYRRK